MFIFQLRGYKTCFLTLLKRQQQMHSFNQANFICLSLLSIRGSETSFVPPELKNKHRVQSFFSAKESIFRVKNLKFSFMGASPFSKTRINPANKVTICRINAANNLFLRFFTLKMDSLAEKNECTRCLFFSSGVKRLIS